MKNKRTAEQKMVVFGLSGKELVAAENIVAWLGPQAGSLNVSFVPHGKPVLGPPQGDLQVFRIDGDATWEGRQFLATVGKVTERQFVFVEGSLRAIRLRPVSSEEEQ